MSDHTFFHADAGTVTLTTAPLWPYTRRIVPRSKRGRSDAGDVVVATLGNPDTFYELRFEGLTQAEADALEAFFATIGYDADAFTWTDHDATARTARLWDSDLTLSQQAPDVHDLTLHLLVEG